MKLPGVLQAELNPTRVAVTIERDTMHFILTVRSRGSDEKLVIEFGMLLPWRGGE
jgi:hypothetical protein